jgi:transglutaminase-like putative cysteine protease
MNPMRTFHIDCELSYDVAQQTHFLFNLGVRNDATQHVVAESITATAGVGVDEFADPRTENRLVRINAPAGGFNIRYLATVDVEAPAVDHDAHELSIAQIPGPIVPFLYASRYCEADQLFHFAVEQFGHLPRGYARVEAICQWIRDNIAYRIGTSSPLTTAKDVLNNRAGVCRDYAHLAIAFCRALNIPARIVTGYACYGEPPPDFHAVFEAYLDGGWYLFDPTLLSRLDEIVRIGIGVDAAEVAFATFFGAARMRRLSPLIKPFRLNSRMRHDDLVELQTPTSGIMLAA